MIPTIWNSRKSKKKETVKKIGGCRGCTLHYTLAKAHRVYTESELQGKPWVWGDELLVQTHPLQQISL